MITFHLRSYKCWRFFFTLYDLKTEQRDMFFQKGYEQLIIIFIFCDFKQKSVILCFFTTY